VRAAVAEARDSLGTKRKGMSIVGSHYQKTGEANSRQRRLKYVL
jgi:hypothetical protein